MLAEILKITIPSLVVFFTAYFVLKTVLKKDNENRRLQIVLQNQKIITPLRLQAYERIILFLERISPNSVIMRLQTPNMTVQQLHKEMLITIRSEFEHNLSQQLYLSIESWEQIRNAKEKTIKLLNMCLEGIDQNENAIKYSQIVFEKLIEIEKSPTQEAIDFIKKEIKQLY
ncbi:MAG TPA: hypothetical protein PLL66_09875 [Bacteroidales bacterium]|nr:hypothetical protein [Bacteroidales bacterium]